MEQIERRILLQKDTYEKVEKAYSNYKKSPKERITIGYVQGRLDALDTYWKEFKVSHEKILLAISIEDRQLLAYFSDDMFDMFEELFYTYKGELKTALLRLSSETEKVNTSKQNVSNPSTSTSNNEIRLPRISIPTFSGNYTDWQSFHDLFVALIHNNASIENVQKLHYLKGSLTGEAEVLLRQFSITGDNYTEAWSILKKRYDNKRYIANNIFKKFFGQRALSQESAAGIKQLLDTTVECMNALKNLGLPTDQWDAILIFIVVSKLDVNSHKQWEEAISGDDSDEIPGFKRLKLFLETRFRTLEMIEPVSKGYKPAQSVKPKTFHATASNGVPQCTFCKEDHYMYNCKQFAKLPIEERYSVVQENSLCFNCLVPNHTVFKCRQGTTCQICKKKHHSLLHKEKKQVSEGKQDTTATIEEHNTQTNHEEEVLTKVTGHVTNREQPGQIVLLATALVDVTSSSGQSHVVRCLIDQGSEVSFVTARVVELLEFKKTQISGVISGVGEGNKMSLKHLLDLQIKSRYDTNFTLHVNAHVLRSITRRLPAREVRGFSWPQLRDIRLADPTFNVPGMIDILLGADVFGKIIDTGLMRGPGNVVAQQSHLGWILSGNMDDIPSRSRNVTNLHVVTQVEEDNKLQRKFWKLRTELYTTKEVWSQDDKKCDEIHKNTTTRSAAGRYEEHLPLKQNIEEPRKLCGEIKHQPMPRFTQLEKKFEKHYKVKEDNKKVINDCMHIDHMEKEDEEIVIYPAQPDVVREDEEKSKVSVISDASAKDSNGRAWNGDMLVDPILQPDFRHLISGRGHKICMVSDIDKVEDLKGNQLLAVTGTTAAPHLTTLTLLQQEVDESENCPRDAAVVKDSLYKDDLMTSNEDTSEMKIKVKEVTKIIRPGFHKQKRSSSSEEWSKFLQDSNEEIKIDKGINKDETTEDNLKIKIDKFTNNILELTWKRKDNIFKGVVNLPELRNPVTKRSMLSDVARVDDPVGSLAPVIETEKRHVQSRHKPADLTSRGVVARGSEDNKMWCTGSDWLKENDIKTEAVSILTNLEVKRTFHISYGEERLSSVTKIRIELIQHSIFLKWKDKINEEYYLTTVKVSDIKLRLLYYQHLAYESEVDDSEKCCKIKSKSYQNIQITSCYLPVSRTVGGQPYVMYRTRFTNG